MQKSDIGAYIIILLLATTDRATAERKRLLFLQTVVKFDSRYIENHTFNITNKRQALNIVLNLAQDFTRDPWVQHIIAFQEPKTLQYKTLFNYDLNVCDLLGKDSNDNINLMQMWMANFLKYGTLPKSCPVMKGHYNWSGLKLDKLSLPPFLLNGKYRAYINTYFRASSPKKLRDSIANLTVFLQIK